MNRLLAFAGAVLLLLTVLITALPIVMLITGQAHGATRRMCGAASWYGSESGRRTADGSLFDPARLSFAMRSRDFGRRYRITRAGRSVIAVHNDYGPAAWVGRRFDLSRGTAAALGMIEAGTALVCVEPID